MKYIENCRVRRSGVVVDEDGWYADSVWEYYLNADQLSQYHDDAARCINRLLRMPPAARKRLKQVAIRCPVKGCLLATIYEFSASTTTGDFAAGCGHATQYLYVGGTSAGTEVWDILNYACACAQILYWRAGCRCGTASLDRIWMEDLFLPSDHRQHGHKTELEANAMRPPRSRVLDNTRVCHPEPGAWHAKKAQPRVLASRSVNSTSRPRCSR